MGRHPPRPGTIGAMTAAPWNLMTLAPLSPAMSGAMLGDAPIAVVAPDRDDREAVRAALADAELLIYDWRASATGLTAEDIAAAPAPRVHPAAERRRTGARHRRPGRRRRAVGQRRRVQRRGGRRVGARRAVRRRPPPQLGRARAPRGPMATGGRDRPRAVRDRWTARRHRRFRPHRPRRGRPAAGDGLHGVVLVTFPSGSRRRARGDVPGARRADRHERRADQPDRPRRRDARSAVGRPDRCTAVRCARGQRQPRRHRRRAGRARGRRAGAPRRRRVRRLRDRAAAGRQPAAAVRPDPADLAHGRVDPGVLRPHGGPPQRQHPPGRHRPTRPQRRQRRRPVIRRR